ncbi:MAG: hypothetical protein PT120_02860 [Aphanizomenon gracile PMC649.10]|nr:hypothetical protein [Aphanizomenon gracile PMC649.10]
MKLVDSLIQIFKTELDEIITIKEVIYEKCGNKANSYQSSNFNFSIIKIIQQEFKVPNNIKEEKRQKCSIKLKLF